MRPLLYGAVLFFTVFSNSTQASLKIAVVDTGFCPSLAKTHSKNHKVLPVLDMAGAGIINCKKVTNKILESSGRFHGQKVLNEFLKYLPPNRKVSIRPLVIYDAKGEQTESAWREAIQYIAKEKIDFVLTASGFIYSEKIVLELPSIWFIPSGRAERGLSANAVLFPQSLAPKPNIFVIGDYFDGAQIIYDQALLYQEQIDYYFPSGKKNFSGTSRAVAEALATALKLCLLPKDIIASHSLRLCLMKNEKILKDSILKKEFKTF